MNDEAEDPIVELTQAEAQYVVQKFCDALAALGWDYALVSVARVRDLGEGRRAAPGATGMHCDRRRMAPALDNEADALEGLAKRLRAMTRADLWSATESYVHDKTDYASGGKEWPR